MRGAAGSGDIAITVDASEAEKRYQPLYEQQIDPFKRFKQVVRIDCDIASVLLMTLQEQTQRVRQLSMADRAALIGGRLILTNKLGRNFFFFYALTLHMIIFVLLYRLSSCS